MSEQIREQVSAFLDGELPSSETELLLKRLTRDAELRQSFGRYALIGETLRGGSHASLSLGFAARVNRAIDGEPAPLRGCNRRVARHCAGGNPLPGTAVAAGVAAVAVVALQQRAVAPGLRSGAVRVTAQNARLVTSRRRRSPIRCRRGAAEAPAMVPAARLTSYVFAHSKYSVGLGQGNLLSDAAEPTIKRRAYGEAVSQPVPVATLRKPAAPPATRDAQNAP